MINAISFEFCSTGWETMGQCLGDPTPMVTWFECLPPVSMKFLEPMECHVINLIN